MASKPYVVRLFLAHTRLFFSALVAGLAAVFLPFEGIERSIVAWNIGTVLFLALVGKMMISSSRQKMEARADEEEGKFLVLFLALAAVVFSLVTIVYELGAIKQLVGNQKLLHFALVAFTILTSWLFIHTIYALHYAHAFYDKAPQGHAGGLDFPGTKLPDYADFLYFSFIIGTSAQTADVGITSQSLRRVSLIHCVMAFLFNTTILALTINICSNLI
ncbi:MAG: DUF1345 domain-containing protein [Moraxellaceae bacterium]|nr:DUF1345 domain-containing protein [Pseudobdellovibrionaceae bacterium]